MQLEDYFDFLAADDIRLKGTRIGIETVLYDFIYGSQSPEGIVARYPSLTIEQDDFEDGLLAQRGGLGRAYQLFGAELQTLVQQMNERLAA